MIKIYNEPVIDEYGFADFGTGELALSSEQLFGTPSMYPNGDVYEEYWVEIRPGYWISDCGYIWSAKTNKMMKIGKNVARKYPGVRLCFGKGPGELHTLHKLLAEAFIPNPKNHALVRHLDDNKDNYDLDNLAWGTSKENWQDAIDNGCLKPLSKEIAQMAAESNRKPVRVINKQSRESSDFASLKEAAQKVGYTSAYVCKCLKGSWDNKYYAFEYIEEE